jgi:hypothetical protein
VNTIAFLNPWEDPCPDEDDPAYDPMALAVTIVWHNQQTGEILDAATSGPPEPAPEAPTPTARTKVAPRVTRATRTWPAS